MPADNTNRSALSELMKVSDQRLKGKVITQYAAVCVRPNPEAENDIQVLLITSRGSRRWVIPKGCRIPRKKPHEVARQEAWEEAGVRGQVKKKPVGHYTYVKKLRGPGAAPALVQVHLLNVSELEQDYPEMGQRELQWFSPEEAACAVDEPELKTLLRGIRKLYKKA
ncbi:DNA mismatch repair protein MutT [Ensifer sp. LCM 4579]|nr:DNA mismatch repair protein MutT [Ensifer sp. LCM 4579]